jgi:hypothetical protein
VRFALPLLLTTGTAAAAPTAELGFGGGAFWGHDDIAISRTTSLFFQGAFPVGERFDIVVGFEGWSANYSPEPTNEQSVVNVVGGLRWYPYGTAREDGIRLSTIYVAALTGVSLLTLIPYDSFFETNNPDAAGLVGSAAIGWLPLRPAGLVMGMEARGDLILYNEDFGFRKSLTLDVILQIHFK